MSPRSRIIWTTFGVTLSIALPLIGIWMSLQFPKAIIENIALHASLETLGGMFAVLIASILVVEQQTGNSKRDYLTWTATGFALMGVLDVLHAFGDPGNTTIWLHVIATLLGGMAFSMVWAGSNWISSRASILIPCLAAAGAFGIGIGSFAFPYLVPKVSERLLYGPPVIGLSAIGGLGFASAAVFYVRRFHRQYDITDWLLSVQTTLFGAVSLLVYFSSFWDLAWWWWHVLRVAAYVSAFVVAVRSYLGVEKKLLQVNRKLRDVNLTLDSMVVCRTRELEESNAQLSRDRFLLNTLVDKIPDAVFFKDRQGRFLKVNHAMAADAGIDDPADFVGKTDADIWQGELPREAGEDERRIIETGVPILNKEEQPITSNGQPRWVLVTKMPLQDESGQIVGTFGIAREITEQKLAEIRLRESETRFRLLVEHSPDASVTLDIDQGRFSAANRQAEELFKMSREEIVKHHPAELSPEFQPGGIPSTQLAQEMIEMALSGQRMVFDWVHQDAEQNDIPCEVRLVPLPFGDRRLLQATISDISARKQAEQELTDARDAAREANRELRRARDVAEEASRAKNDFLANVSHELRTPMHAIIGMTELLLGMEMTGIQRENLEIVVGSAESLMAIIDQLLDFSKIESGKLELEAVEFELHEEIEASVRSLAVRDKTKTVELLCNVAASVPERVIGDPVRLRQVLVNLVGNAIKFTKEGEIVVEVRSRELQPGAVTLEFSVRDTGVGIPADKLDVIFNAFEQADTSTTREYGGTGLGLAITSRLVAAMGGEIWVDSFPGEGSTFYFTVKMNLGSRKVDPTEVGLSGVHVVLAADQSSDREFLSEVLSSARATVDCYEDAGDALSALRQAVLQNRNVVLVVDRRISSTDAFELVGQIRSDSALARTPVILLPSGVHLDDVRRCEELKIHGQLIRPVKRAELIRMISSALRNGDDARTDARLPVTNGASAVEQITPLTILLAEDGKANRTVAVGLLSKCGHQVDVAEDGAQAVEAFRKKRYDAILMDVQMPIMDGLEATRCIRELENGSDNRIPIIAMTAHAMKGDRDRCLAAGMDQYVSKPVKWKELYRTLSVLCSKRTKVIASDSHASIPSRESTSKVFDWNAAAEILGGDRHLIDRILREAITRMNFLLPKLGDAIEKGEQEASRRIARAIRELAHTIVAEQVVAAAASFENAVGDDEAVVAAFASLKLAVSRLGSAIARNDVKQSEPLA